ncbi:MAG: sulfite exporter TauE/SafE family protein [Gammaproteobacteria bacterium]|nr:sulfite exporter TauE/SafE family protein [Gammaproteobacteria bacterium]
MHSHTLSLFAAFVAGLAATAHCFAMCGGIASALGLHARAAGTGVGAYGIATLYQLGRLSGYTLAGGVCGFIGSQASALFELMRLGPLLRAASGLIIVLLGVRLLWQWDALRWIEQLGAKFWVRLRPLLQAASTRTGVAKPLALGMLWSLLPCGLVYSMLTFAALSADTARGALIMFAFGLGTLPSMLTASLLAARVQALLARPIARFLSGVILVGLGAWMIVAALQMGGHGHGHMH